MLRRLRTCLAALALAAVPTLVLVPAPGTANAAMTGPAVALRPPPTTSTSGYASTGAAGGYTEAGAVWVQPAGNCTSATTGASFWVGLGGGGSLSTAYGLRIGTDTDCSGGSPTYYAWYSTTLNSQITLPLTAAPLTGSRTISAGDLVVAEISCDGSPVSCNLSFDDWGDGGASADVALTPSTTSFNSAEAIISRQINVSGTSVIFPPLANFGTVNFSEVTFNNQAPSALSPVQLSMYNSASLNMDTISTLSTTPSPVTHYYSTSPAYSSFSGTWLRSS